MNFFNQSLFALYVLKNNFNFLDIGCSGTKDSVCFPLLDNGCDGYFIDIEYFEGWDNFKFFNVDATNVDWNFIDLDIDYVLIDVEGLGDRYNVLHNLNWNWNIKVIVIEHDVYRTQSDIGNYDDMERIPQRKFLLEMGYKLICSDVTFTQDDTLLEMPYEDWWVHEDYYSNCKKIVSDRENCLSLYTKLLKEIEYDKFYKK